MILIKSFKGSLKFKTILRLKLKFGVSKKKKKLFHNNKNIILIMKKIKKTFKTPCYFLQQFQSIKMSNKWALDNCKVSCVLKIRFSLLSIYSFIIL